MSTIFTILADGEVHWEKLLPFLVFFVLWALGQLSSAGKKKSPQAPTAPRPPQPVAPPPPLIPRAATPRAIPPRVLSLPARGQAQKRRAVRRSPPLPPKPLAPAAPPPVVEIVEPAPTTSAAVAQRPRPILRLRPNDLRSQFILTEILKPPLALRPRDGGAN
jgi:hypothetical protein